MRFKKPGFASLLLAAVLALLAWNCYAAGPLQKGALIVFIVLVVLFVLSVLAAFVSPRVRTSLTLIVVSASLSLAAIEAAAPTWGEYAPLALAEGYDRRSRHEVLLDLRDQGVAAVALAAIRKEFP